VIGDTAGTPAGDGLLLLRAIATREPMRSSWTGVSLVRRLIPSTDY
jgi:hypothetical protein